MPFLSLLAILFITLKLTDVIDWSWWAVTAPLWVLPIVFFSGLFIAAGVWLSAETRRLKGG